MYATKVKTRSRPTAVPIPIPALAPTLRPPAGCVVPVAVDATFVFVGAPAVADSLVALARLAEALEVKLEEVAAIRPEDMSFAVKDNVIAFRSSP